MFGLKAMGKRHLRLASSLSLSRTGCINPLDTHSLMHTHTRNRLWDMSKSVSSPSPVPHTPRVLPFLPSPCSSSHFFVYELSVDHTSANSLVEHVSRDIISSVDKCLHSWSAHLCQCQLPLGYTSNNVLVSFFSFLSLDNSRALLCHVAPLLIVFDYH